MDISELNLDRGQGCTDAIADDKGGNPTPIRLRDADTTALAARLRALGAAAAEHRELLENALAPHTGGLAARACETEQLALASGALSDLAQQQYNIHSPARRALEAFENPITRSLVEALESPVLGGAAADWEQVKALRNASSTALESTHVDRVFARTPRIQDFPQNPIHDTNALLAEQGEQVERQAAHMAALQADVGRIVAQFNAATADSRRDALWSRVIAVVATIVAVAGVALAAWTTIPHPAEGGIVPAVAEPLARGGTESAYVSPDYSDATVAQFSVGTSQSEPTRSTGEGVATLPPQD